MNKEDDWGDYPKPNGVTGYENAGSGLKRVLADAERRVTATDAPEPVQRITDILVHIQPATNYENAEAKEAIMEASMLVLEAMPAAADMTPEQRARWNEAMAALRAEEERVFVVVITSNVGTLVYWNWDFAYRTGNAYSDAAKNPVVDDAMRRSVASPEKARRAYGTEVDEIGGRWSI